MCELRLPELAMTGILQDTGRAIVRLQEQDKTMQSLVFVGE